ncbi:MAG: acyl-ACP--UDP-N-acetylglucosamine O-acyltransferase [Phycisphaerales bacterium]
MAEIHPTSLIDPAARLASDVTVGPYCIIGPHVKIGAGTQVQSHVVIEGHTTIGCHNRIFHHTVLGGEPQDLKYRGEPCVLEIGDHNDIREFVTMHIGTENGGGRTTVGSHNLLMVGAHIAHDSHIGDRVIMANNVLLAGHVVVEDYAVVSGGAAIHHFVTVGRYAFIGGNAGVVHDCPPYMMSDGHPAAVRSVNTIGLERHHFPASAIENLKEAYRLLFKREEGNQSEVIDRVERRFAEDALVMEVCRFARRMTEGIHGRWRETQRRDNKRTAPAR